MPRRSLDCSELEIHLMGLLQDQVTDAGVQPRGKSPDATYPRWC
jgi:hypothetical protein